MGWCQAKRVDYVFGLARNRRLEAALVDQLATAKRLCFASGQPARVFRDFQYRTIDSWSRTRRVVGKAEHTLEGANPRFVVTSLKRTHTAYDARALYAFVHDPANLRSGEKGTVRGQTPLGTERPGFDSSHHTNDRGHQE